MKCLAINDLLCRLISPLRRRITSYNAEVFSISRIITEDHSTIPANLIVLSHRDSPSRPSTGIKNLERAIRQPMGSKFVYTHLEAIGARFSFHYVLLSRRWIRGG